VKRVRHVLTLLHEFAEFAAANKAWWIVPIGVILLGVAAIVTLTSSATPLIYMLF